MGAKDCGLHWGKLMLTSKGVEASSRSKRGCGKKKERADEGQVEQDRTSSGIRKRAEEVIPGCKDGKGKGRN